MNDPRDDLLLCPDCYIPVEFSHMQFSRQIYACLTCNNSYTEGLLVRASALQRRIELGIQDAEREVKHGIKRRTVEN